MPRRPLPLAALALSLAARAASAQLTGSAIGLQYRSPSQAATLFDLGTAVVGAGVEFTAFGLLAVDVGASTLTVTSLDPNPLGFGFAPAPFNGVRLYDPAGGLPRFTSAAVGASTTVAGFDASRITFDADNLYVNLSGLLLPPTGVVVVDIGTAAAVVPEPATVALAGAGVLLLGAWARRRGAA